MNELNETSFLSPAQNCKRTPVLLFKDGYTECCCFYHATQQAEFVNNIKNKKISKSDQ